MEQTVLLTQNIEDCFEAKQKAGAVFVNLTTVYDIVWQRGFTFKLLKLLPDERMIMEFCHTNDHGVSLKQGLYTYH